jgi:Na+/H+-dicarboxylate symporter
MNRTLTIFVVVAMVAGVLAGWACHELLDKTGVANATLGFGIITDLFLRAIKMIIAPLVFTTLVSGIAHMEDAAAIRGVGLKTIAWFVLASLVSLTIGLIMVHLLHPGLGLSLPNPDPAALAKVDASTFTLKDFVSHLVPTSIFDAMAKNEILQIVVFSVLVGTAVSAVEERAPAVMAVVEQGAAIMLKVTGYVMLTAPFAIFAALASSVASHGIEVLATYAKFVGGFYLSLGVLWSAFAVVAFVAVGKRAFELFMGIRNPTLLAFSTASSEAAYPRTLEALVAFGLPRRIVSFVLPLGYSFNLDGSMMYCTFATLFIAQVYNVHLSIQQQITMLLLLMVTSKGMAGVPRASLVVISATLTFFHLPQAGLLLILAVDFFLDMGRSATNVVGNSVAAVVVTRLEGKRAVIEAPSLPPVGG